jgi:hypothetical protein
VHRPRAAEARQSHRPVTISEDDKPVAALINIDDLADLEDRAALAARLAYKAAGQKGISTRRPGCRARPDRNIGPGARFTVNLLRDGAS